MNNSTIVWVVLAIIIVAGGAWYFVANNNAAPATAPTTDTTGTVPAAGTTAGNTVTVLYGPNGFSPSTVTIKQGDTVTFTNNGGDEMWIASAPHPTHEGYDGTTKDQHCVAGYSGPAPFDQCAVGTTFSFKFDKAGTWKYHNHGNASDFGTVIVQ